MKVTSALVFSSCCLAATVWAQSKPQGELRTAPTVKPALVAAPVVRATRPDIAKEAQKVSFKVSTLAELKGLRASVPLVEVPPAPASGAPAAAPAQPVGSAYQQGNGVLLTVQAMTDATTKSWMELDAVHLADNQYNVMRWLSYLPRAAGENMVLVRAHFLGIPTGPHTYMVSAALTPNNGTSNAAITIDVAGAAIPAAAVIKSGGSAYALFTYDNKASGGWLDIALGWSAVGAGWQTLVFQQVQLAVLD